MVRASISKFKRVFARWVGLKPLSIIDRLGDDPLCVEPNTDPDSYLQLYENTRKKKFPKIDKFEKSVGSHLEMEWFENLALHTQIVVKKSELNYQHGRVVYAALFDRCQKLLSSSDIVNVFETGTARGFSALCMAKVFKDTGKQGKIITVDILPHDKAMFWNCIDDHSGRKTRRELLLPWDDLLDFIIFFQSDTNSALERLGLNRIHFAFLDASHTYEDVISEFQFVSKRQQSGDVIVFDDVTPNSFPGVVEAVNKINRCHPYLVEYLEADEARRYAIAVRK